MMNRQKVYNKIRWFADNKISKSVSAIDACVYNNTYNGVGCFVGMFLRPETAEFLDRNIAAIFPLVVSTVRDKQFSPVYADYAADVLRLITDETPVEFWRSVQLLHDNFYGTKEFEREFAKLQTEFPVKEH